MLLATTVTVAQAKIRLSRLIAEAGGEMVIARGAKPAVRLVRWRRCAFPSSAR